MYNRNENNNFNTDNEVQKHCNGLILPLPPSPLQQQSINLNNNNNNNSVNKMNLCNANNHQNNNNHNNNNGSVLNSSASKKVVSEIPRERQQLLKWNGWGYNDSKFLVTGENNTLSFTGNRYPIGNLELPNFKLWVLETFNLDLTNRNPAQPLPTVYPAPKECSEFIEEIKKLNIHFSQTGEDRLIRSHGQTLYDIHLLREGKFNRIPDIVVYPVCHRDVVEIVKYANEYNVTIIPFGGGTSVSGSISCPQREERPICIVDTTQMNRMLWLDRENLVVCFESGIYGQDLERELKAIGLTVGHEPDSYEFSTLGGWVATRASGMKKNIYGNIEDLVVRVKMVTSKGTLERNCSAPRVSCGPDFNHIILGSEGTLGIVTEVVLKIRKLPPVRLYGSLVFPQFENGVRCLREIAEKRLQPSSIRLMDNEQFRFGKALTPEHSWFSAVQETVKKMLLTKVKGFDLGKMCVATLLFEGEDEDVKRQEKKVIAIAKRYGGLSAGAEHGERGYVLTFVIAYIRDLALEFYIIAESFETSMPWNKCEILCRNTKQRVKKECAKLGIQKYLISCRVTQTYDAGACVYFYFGFSYYGIPEPVEAYEYVENCARDEILACGGSISHHHGVGKLRSKWYPQSVTSVGVNLYKAAKSELDPKNIFAVGNLIGNENEHEHGHGHDNKNHFDSKL